MEVKRGIVYLYEFDSYDKLSMDIELLMDLNQEYNFTLYSRLPTRRLIEKLDLSKINHFWIANNEENTAIKPSIQEIIQSITNHDETTSNIFLIDGLEYLYNNGNNIELLSRLVTFADLLKSRNWAVIYCINSLAFDSDWIIKLRHLSDKLEINTPELESYEFEDKKEENVVLPEEDNNLFELAIDGGPRMAYLARLPRLGFTNEILVKRILQWRRMGLDVSRIEPALTYDIDEAYELYQSVEEDVRRATELERFIHDNESLIEASDLATDMFRIRQLTGLNEIERKYYNLS
ncbi:MAG: DUF835 domain-containing protein [Candidatus Poseidoniaceae archaeon]